MTLSSRGKYATRALLHLSLHYEEGPVQIQEIAERQNIPLKYLEQILLSLKRYGFVNSRKGPGGGYSLAMPPQAITLGAVVRAVDGPLSPISCASVSGYAECGCPEPATCGLRAIWKEARDALAAIMDGTTFAEIRDQHLRLKAEGREVLDYAI
jgi:Rrf2 family transcriptional regulator, cysteine metabolism repressor